MGRTGRIRSHYPGSVRPHHSRRPGDGLVVDHPRGRERRRRGRRRSRGLITGKDRRRQAVVERPLRVLLLLLLFRRRAIQLVVVLLQGVTPVFSRGGGGQRQGHLSISFVVLSRHEGACGTIAFRLRGLKIVDKDHSLNCLMSGISKREGGAVLLREMRKNVPFPRRSVAAVPPQTERREIRVPRAKFSSVGISLIMYLVKAHHSISLTAPCNSTDSHCPKVLALFHN